MKLSQTRIAIVLAVLVVTSSGCGLINRIRAKNELNEAARTYREGHFEEAEQHSRRALELDPTSKTAPSFIARTIHAQYRPGVQSPENLAKAEEAIRAYQQILQKDPKNEEAYKAIAYLYGATKQEDKLRVSYKKPSDQKEFDNARACVKRGLEEIENAIKLDPNSESAWSYKTNLLLEASKLAEMDGKADQKAELDKQREVAQKRTNALSEANQKKKEEEEAKKAASPAKK